MDIVIPYKQDPHRGLELLFALRSIEKYLPYRNIWVIGDKPNLNVRHLPCKDFDGRKEFSIAFKISVACKCDQISEDFIMFNDDHFMLAPTEIKYWHGGTLEEALLVARGGYKRAVENTIEKYPGNNFDIHTPIIFNKAEFLNAFNWTEEFCVKSMYCNSLGIKGEYMKDCKLNFPYSKSAIEEKIKDRLFFSTGPMSMTEELIEVFKTLYPKPSIHEISSHTRRD